MLLLFQNSLSEFSQATMHPPPKKKWYLGYPVQIAKAHRIDSGMNCLHIAGNLDKADHIHRERAPWPCVSFSTDFNMVGMMLLPAGHFPFLSFRAHKLVLRVEMERPGEGEGEEG